MVNLPGRKRAEYGRGDKVKEEKLKHAMTYLGLKDTQLLDHLNPGFHKALTMKTTNKLRELRAMTKSYDDD